MEYPLISVVISTYNRASCITNSVQSVINQTYRNWEIIIVDSSTDGATRPVLEPYLTNSRIKYFYRENLNSSQGLNFGISNTNGEYVALLDDDDEFIENKLEVQLSEMLKHNADFSISNCIKVYDGRKTSPVYYPESFFLTKEDLIKGRFHMSHTHMMFRSTLKEDCKFDPLVFASDDFDLLARIISKYRILYIKEPLSFINKSIKRPRISNNPQMRIDTFEQLIRKIYTYDWTKEEKQKLINILTIRRGFWLMMNKNYKQGRKCISEMIFYLPYVKRIKYILFYLFSYFPFIFETSRFITEFLWSLSKGKIKG